MLQEWDEIESLPVGLERGAVPLVRGGCRSSRLTSVPLKQLITQHQHAQYAAACVHHPILVPEECDLFTPTATLDQAWQVAKCIPDGMAYYRVGPVWLADEPPF
jgi:hypothetical protein